MLKDTNKPLLNQYYQHQSIQTTQADYSNSALSQEINIPQCCSEQDSTKKSEVDSQLSSSHQPSFVSNDYNEGSTQIRQKKEILKATIAEREQIICHFNIVINLEKGFLLHVTLSVILCILIQCGFFVNNTSYKTIFQETSNKSAYISTESNMFITFIPKDPFLGIIDYYLISMIQNFLYMIILSRIISEDRKLLFVMKSILSQERDQVKRKQSTIDELRNQVHSQQEIQESNGDLQSQPNEDVQSTAISLIDSLIQDNLIVSRRNKIARSEWQMIDQMDTHLCQKQQSDIKIQQICEKSQKQEDVSFLNLMKELYQFESGIIHHRVTSKKDHITLYNVLENITETHNFGSKLLVASSTVILFVYNIAQMGTHTLDPQYEIGILAYLGIPAMMMILPFCVVMLTLATSVLFLLIYGVSILLLLTYSVISKQILFLFKIMQLRSKLLQNLPQISGKACSICLFDFDDPLERVSLLKCNHPFHYDCIKLWMQEKDDCPVCRKKY